MDIKIAKQVIGVIRREREERSDRLTDEDPSYADDVWQGVEEPFFNDMCLMTLVALRHHVERELISLAALANTEEDISIDEYQKRLAEKRKLSKSSNGWQTLDAEYQALVALAHGRRRWRLCASWLIA